MCNSIIGKYYEQKTGEKIEQMTMEFVNFKDNPEPIGARVVEGWALSGQLLSAE
ncbi:hypothetical protein [Anaerobium acetethylicum]|uniref:Uncharacterized protein n=1 Tax=Anaerobium acetethylicum TaxID=1619234 RepID=A0A1D3TYE8_9FIRM|nr:hypothetical protein [Anaerobium acetethylicum]SCP99451.1 hypothetical protein SAMN05421730_10422 [Anaerobium acetethylicum]